MRSKKGPLFVLYTNVPSRGIRQSLNSESGEYTVAVDYGNSIEVMVSAGRYDYHNTNINSENFSMNGTGVVQTTLELIHLNEEASSEAVLAYLEEKGLRPATIEELLAFGATYPEVQRQFPVVALGSSWVHRSGSRPAPFLSMDGSERKLYLGWYDYDWLEDCRFLAVRK